jgi:hypothetical protein
VIAEAETCLSARMRIVWITKVRAGSAAREIALSSTSRLATFDDTGAS